MRKDLLFKVNQDYRQSYLSNSDEGLRHQSFEVTTNTVADNWQQQECLSLNKVRQWVVGLDRECEGESSHTYVTPHADVLETVDSIVKRWPSDQSDQDDEYRENHVLLDLFVDRHRQVNKEHQPSGVLSKSSATFRRAKQADWAGCSFLSHVSHLPYPKHL